MGQDYKMAVCNYVQRLLLRKEGKIMKIKFKRSKAGHYYYGQYQINRWYPESNSYVLWCVSIDNVGLDDYRTLKQAKAHIIADIMKTKELA
jgi:hypothetical protein